MKNYEQILYENYNNNLLKIKSYKRTLFHDKYVFSLTCFVNIDEWFEYDNIKKKFKKN